MTIPFGTLRLNITITLSPSTTRTRGWEELSAVGLDDHELPRLNERNSRDYDGAPWTAPRLIAIAPRRS
jgi:hypothetical protein